MQNGRITTLDEETFRTELDEVMGPFRTDFDRLRTANAPAIAYLLAANERLAQRDLGIDRHVGLRDT